MPFQLPVNQLMGRFVLVLCFAFVAPETNFTPSTPSLGQEQAEVDRFDLLTDTSGWILLHRQLFWTSDRGQAWNEIGPTIPSGAAIQDIEFLNAETGWILWTLANSDGSADFQLAHTTNAGLAWTIRSLPLFERGDIASYAEKAEMGWFDEQTGWISVKRNSGSNFSIGTLFTTSDAGVHWTRFTLPVADKIYFSNPQTGWAVGGPANDQIFSTEDGGASWKDVRPLNIKDGMQIRVYPPVALDGQGVLVMTALGAENNLNVYSLQDSGRWLSIGQEKLDLQPGIMALSILDPQNLTAVIPGTSLLVRLKDGELDILNNEDGLSASIVELDMVSLEIGWAKAVASTCISATLSDPRTASVSCSSSTRLLQTRNGGVTWQTVALPMVQLNNNSPTVSDKKDMLTVSATMGMVNTLAFVGQGFDRCEIPTISQMQAWSVSSPYQTVNLYIGGSNRTCENSALTASYIFQLYEQGWKFFPTWVGPQAPCTGYLSRMSSDMSTAYQQGVEQANLVVERLAELGLTDPYKSGSVIYYDIEYYGTETGCRSAVNAFMDGWVAQIHARGNLAGVYGSTLCNTGLSDFLTITNVADVIWPARWYHNAGSGYYDPNASVWNLGSCLPNTVWSNHQRIRQYEGEHNETWGNLTLDIDSDVLDGVVAIPYDYPFVSNTASMDSNPTNASHVDFMVTFSKPVVGVDETDFELLTVGVNGADIINVTGSGSSYTVTVNTGIGDGTIRLDVVDDNTIVDTANNPLGGFNVGDGDFKYGETYTVLKTTFRFPAADFNGDGKTDLAVFHPRDSTWYIQGADSFAYGQAGDIPVPADYNGDGQDDIALFRPTNSTWYVYGVGAFVYGTVGDIPVVADYNGDGKTDIAVFRPSNSTWYIYGVGPRVYGTAGDIPVVADYDGDGKDDIAVFRPTNGTWYIRGIGAFVYGTVGDIPVVADYNGDGKSDIAVFRPTNSTWYLYRIGPRVYGTVGDIPVVGDYNGDGKADMAVFRPSNSTWYLYGIGPQVYGTVGDIPV